MTRRSTISSTFLRAALPMLALGLAACSFNFKAGGGTSSEAGKPAPGTQDPGTPASKPIAGADTKPAGTDPAGAEPAAEPVVEVAPDTTKGADDPPPVVDPRDTAVCRVEDKGLSVMCHTALDPVAANDMAAWESQLADEMTMTRPSHQEGLQRLRTPESVRKMADDAGGLRALLHLSETDRLVVTLHNDCRNCASSFVAFEANSRSGTIVVTLDMNRPSKITKVEIASQVGRRHLGEHKRIGKRMNKKGHGTLEAPKEPSTDPKTEAPSKGETKGDMVPKPKPRPKAKLEANKSP